MLLTKTVKINWSCKMKKYYIEKGYVFTKIGDEFEVKVEDLTDGSEVEIECLCDYCNESISKLKWRLYQKQVINKKVHKYCCKKCSPLKHKELMMLNYGVESPMHIKEIKEKVGDMFRKDFNIIEAKFKEMDYTILIKEEEYKKANMKIPYICNRHKDKGVQYIAWNKLTQGHGCGYCGIEKISGENSHLWKGGISPLHNLLRKKIEIWKQDSMINCKYNCLITGKNFDVIHHSYGFNMMLEETLRELNLPLHSKTNEYSDNELIDIENKCLEVHYKHGLGICLNESIHKLFHSIYGTGNNTHQQFKEFVTRLEEGEFSDFLKENNLDLNIDYNVLHELLKL